MLYLLLPALLALAPAIAGAAVPETRYRAPLANRPAEKQATTPDRHGGHDRKGHH